MSEQPSSPDGEQPSEPAQPFMERIIAPWTITTALALNDYQRSMWFHPFTCPREHAEHVRLIADTDGWWCPMQECDYTQTWAHEFMVMPRPKYPWDK